MQASTKKRTSVTGKKLHLRIWEPEGKPKGALVLCHGLGEHGGRYAHVAEHYTDRGFVVYAQDHLGFGESEGRRGDLPHWNTLPNDVQALAAEIKDAHGDKLRRVLLGHSMGGLIGLAALRRDPDAFGEAVIIAPAINVTRGVNPVLLALSKILRYTVPFITLDNTLNPDDLCTDKAVVEAYKADPLVHRRISSRLFGGMATEGAELRDRPGLVPKGVKLLMLQGADDPICTQADTEPYFESLPSKEKTLKVFPGMLHEVLNEKKQEDVFAAIDAFLGLKA